MKRIKLALKVPRDVKPIRVIILLRSLGYRLAPQTGSHIRLHRSGRPVHTVTFPNRDPIEPRTLRLLIDEVSEVAFLPVVTLIDQL